MSTAVRELEKRLIEVTDAVDRLSTLVELAIRHADEHRNREGLRAAREAVEIARANGDRTSAARALLAASRCEQQRGDLLCAVSTGLEALDGFGPDEGDGRSEALQIVARALMAAQALELAQSLAEGAVAEAAQASQALGEARARVLYAEVLQQRDRHRVARRQYRIAERHYRDLDDRPGRQQALVGLADNYRREGIHHLVNARIAGARRCWTHSLRLYRLALAGPATAADEAHVRAGLAESLCRLGHTAQAYPELARALQVALRGGTPEVVANCYLWECRTLKAMGDVPGAERACRYARIAAEQMEHDGVLVACLEALAGLHELNGRFGNAVDAARRARMLARERETTLGALRDDLGALLHRSGYGRGPRLRSAA